MKQERKAVNSRRTKTRIPIEKQFPKLEPMVDRERRKLVLYYDSTSVFVIELDDVDGKLYLPNSYNELVEKYDEEKIRGKKLSRYLLTIIDRSKRTNHHKNDDEHKTDPGESHLFIEQVINPRIVLSDNKKAYDSIKKDPMGRFIVVSDYYYIIIPTFTDNGTQIMDIGDLVLLNLYAELYNPKNRKKMLKNLNECVSELPEELSDIEIAELWMIRAYLMQFDFSHKLPNVEGFSTLYNKHLESKQFSNIWTGGYDGIERYSATWHQREIIKKLK